MYFSNSFKIQLIFSRFIYYIMLSSSNFLWYILKPQFTDEEIGTQVYGSRTEQRKWHSENLNL